MKKTKILGFNISFPKNKEEYNILKNLKSGYYLFANTNTLVEAGKNRLLHESLRKAEIIFPDGFPLVLTARLKGIKDAERVAGPDFTIDAINYLGKNKITCCFFGGDKIQSGKRKEKLNLKFPDLTFSSFSESEEEIMIKSIKKDKIKHLFVSLGSPKQEIWASKNIKKIRCNIYCIGAAMAYIVGDKSRAPFWMQKFYLEWMYRLIKEPKHSIKRYAINGPKFLFLSMKDIIKK